MISDEYVEIEFLYNINHLKNLENIFVYGLLSRNELKKSNCLNNEDISNSSVQSRRAKKRVDKEGHTLHDYANLYFDARNPMMYYEVCHVDINCLCVICVDKKVLDLKNTLVTDSNASKDMAMIMSPEEGVDLINFDKVKMRYWNHEDPSIKVENIGIKCAEVLVFNNIPKEYFKRIKVCTDIAKEKVESLNLGIKVEIDRDIFFK